VTKNTILFQKSILGQKTKIVSKNPFFNICPGWYTNGYCYERPSSY